MRNIPTDIYIENEAVKNHGGEIAELGKKAMIVTGRHSSAVKADPLPDSFSSYYFPFLRSLLNPSQYIPSLLLLLI